MRYRYVRCLYRLQKVARNKLVDYNIISPSDTQILKTTYINSDDLSRREETQIGIIPSSPKLRLSKGLGSIYGVAGRGVVVKYISTTLLMSTRIELRKIISVRSKVFRRTYGIGDDSRYLSIASLLITAIVYPGQDQVFSYSIGLPPLGKCNLLPT